MYVSGRDIPTVPISYQPIIVLLIIRGHVLVPNILFPVHIERKKKSIISSFSSMALSILISQPMKCLFT